MVKLENNIHNIKQEMGKIRKENNKLKAEKKMLKEVQKYVRYQNSGTGKKDKKEK